VQRRPAIEIGGVGASASLEKEFDDREAVKARRLKQHRPLPPTKGVGVTALIKKLLHLRHVPVPHSLIEPLRGSSTAPYQHRASEKADSGTFHDPLLSALRKSRREIAAPFDIKVAPT